MTDAPQIPLLFGTVMEWAIANGAHDLKALPGVWHGRNLACWCKPGCPCHADVLLELANA